MAENSLQKSIYLFAGEDSFSAFEKATNWKAKFLEKFGELNLLTFQGADLTASEFQTAIEAVPFLSEKKLVFVSDFLADGDDESQKAVAEMLESVPDFCVVVFLEFNKPDARRALYKKLLKFGTVEDFPVKSGSGLTRWVSDRAAKKGLRLGQSEATFMGEYVGANLWNMENELSKLALYAGAGASVDREMIERVVSPNLSSSIFTLTDLLGEKRLADAVRCFQILVESGEEVMGMLFMLVRHFRILSQVKFLTERGAGQGEIAKAVKIAPYFVAKTVKQAREFSMDQYRRIYQWLLELDTAVKTGKVRIVAGDAGELEREMVVFFTRVCL